MRRGDCCQRVDGDKVRDPPVAGEDKIAADHERGHDEAVEERAPEALGDLGDLFDEVAALDFFGCGAPLDIEFEEVAEESLGDVQG